jgi:hypothetical protein
VLLFVPTPFVQEVGQIIELRGFAPIGILEHWNDGIMDSGKMDHWGHGKIPPDMEVSKENK